MVAEDAVPVVVVVPVEETTVPDAFNCSAVKFLNAGIYTYRCSLHSGMIGKINVFAENGLLIDPTPTPSPTSTPTPNRNNQSDQISPPSSSQSYY